MKKNKWYLVGVAVVALVFGLMMAGCSGSSALVGKWVQEDGGFTLELLKDGIGITDNQRVTWVAQKGRLIITLADSAYVFGYTVSGSILTLTNDNGESLRLKKE
jgi:hypothetical protein